MGMIHLYDFQGSKTRRQVPLSGVESCRTPNLQTTVSYSLLANMETRVFYIVSPVVCSTEHDYSLETSVANRINPICYVVIMCQLVEVTASSVK